MLPSVVGRQVADSVAAFLRAAFPMNSPLFSETATDTEQAFNTLEQFLAQPEALLKGPYWSAQLPFRQSSLGLDFFPNLTLPFVPHAHQARAYERLGNMVPQSTLVATGTGSGKTECFMFPLLNYCAGNRLAGVKAIIVYPMNALATDQASRFAKTIASDPTLHGKVTVGLFVGDTEKVEKKRMTADSVITCKHTLRESPPDILLTNYKMLDYLLMRPEDQPLWRFNQQGTLRYLVVDELHTFDGAQGSDLACLVRRLKHHVSVDPAKFACVGTSATVGDDLTQLLDYASTIFDQPFDELSVVREDRLSAEEFLARFDILYTNYPNVSDQERLDVQKYSDPLAYLNAQVTLWFPETILVLPEDLESDEGRELRIELGNMLRKHSMLHVLLHDLRGGILSEQQCRDVIQVMLACDEIHAALVLQSILALIAQARLGVNESSEDQQKRISQNKPRPVRPLVQLRSQLWLRELRRLVASVTAKPKLVFADDLKTEEREQFLPLVHCRDCHATGWASIRYGQSSKLENELDEIYRHFFDSSHSVVLVFPDHNESPENGIHQKLCTSCLTLNKPSQQNCHHCGHEELLSVLIPEMRKERNDTLEFHNECPYCHNKHGLAILGSRAASLSSVMIHQLYSSRFNEHKKLITFSDSVQDAAHRASFFTARTWPLMVRGQIAGVIPQNGSMALDSFAKLVCATIRANSRDEAHFVANFIAPNMQWLNDYQELRLNGQLPEKSNLAYLVELRLNWEVFSEFTLRAAIGRTLETTGFASVGIDIERFNPAIVSLHQQLLEEFGELMAGVSASQVAQMALGVIWHLRQAGAVMHPAFESYRREGKTFMMMKKEITARYMPTIGPKSRKPAYATFEKINGYLRLIGAKTNPSWFQHWLNRTLASNNNLFLSSVHESLLRFLISALQRAGILSAFETAGREAWGLSPSFLIVSRDIERLHCSCCREVLTAPADQAWQWQDAPCMSLRCEGVYQKVDFKRTIQWDHMDLARVVGSEHTGLLTREVREATEQSFYKGDKPWNINLLSATPTLEMGIDVGDLSTVLLCSVPPAQSNYLQRIGRAGRKDGNALNITLAEGNPHDQFFFEEPLEMMQGHVRAPGVFLNAVAILERQLAAFCMDNWVKTGIPASAIYKNVKQMLDEVESGRKAGFPYNFLSYIELNRVNLFERFNTIFPMLTEETQAHLSNYLFGNSGTHSFNQRVDKALTLLSEDRKSLKARMDKLKRTIEKLEGAPKDQNFEDHHRELTSEVRALLELIKKINEKQTLQFFTDEGLLPNYAFPEAGVTLRSVLWRRKDSDDANSSKYEDMTYQYERPASSALAELAPLNNFYAGGHKVEIEQIDLKVSEPENWRICCHCNYSENIDQTGDPHKYCPKCGTPGWADSGQKTTLLKLRQVYARSSAKESQIGDESDTREPTFFQRQLLVNYEPSDVTAAYAINEGDVPFGFEFLSKVTLRDINFGKQADDASELVIAGDKKRRTGFKVCLGCGMVQRPRDHESRHDLSCKYRAEPESAKFEDFLYLYRQLESEALRILLPVSSYSQDRSVEASLGAAIQLGLKHYFKGNVDHLKGVVYREPENEGESWRQYLVIYDSVPGGTGSLKELMRTPGNLLHLLQLAYQALIDCSCNHDVSKDGCYRCVYAYRDRSRMKLVSRNLARQLLAKILEFKENLCSIDSINNIPLDNMMGSELEKRFITVLQENKALIVSRSYAQAGDGWIVNTKTMPSFGWQLRAQVDLGPKDGVGMYCRPDFVLYPFGNTHDIKPVAIFLDGFVFHKYKVDDDVQKRQAILESQQFYVWTLTWRDLNEQGCKHLQDVLGLSHNPDMKHPKFYNLFHDTTFASLESAVRERNSFDLLIEYLTAPDARTLLWQKLAAAHAWVWLDVKKSQNVALKQKFAYEMNENVPHYRQQELLPDEPFVFGGLLDSCSSSQPFIELASVLPQRYINQTTKPEQMRAALTLHLCFDDRYTEDDGYERALNGFWRLVNLLQFLPKMSFTSRKAAQLPYERLATEQVILNKTKVSGLWQEAIALGLLSLEEAELLNDNGLDVPEFGFPLQIASGEIVAEADLAWQSLKIALFYQEGAGHEQFISAGWRVVIGAVNEQTIAYLIGDKE